MKRLLSVLLSLCMVFGCTAFALPVLDTAESAELFEENTEATLSSETVTVYFTGDISTEFAAIEAKAGDVIDLANYLSVELSDTAKASHKRFNGWMPDGVEKNLTTTTVTVADEDGNGKMELVALVNHDFNFALEANRAMWQGYRSTASVGENGNTIHVTPSTTLPSITIENGRDGVDFEIDTTEYKGATVYYAYNDTLSTLWYIYGLGVSNNTAKNWWAESEFCIPAQVPDCLNKNGQFFEKGFDKIYDAQGNILYGGVTTSTDTCYAKSEYLPNQDMSLMTDLWVGTVKALAVPFIWSNSTSYDVRYIRFVPIETAKPGINVLTDDGNPYTFEGTSASDYHLYGGAALVTKDGNSYIEYSGTTSHFALKKALTVINKDRKVKVSFKAEADTAATKSIFLVRNTLNNFNPSLGLVYSSIPTSWATFTKDVMGSSQAVTNNSSVFTDDTQNIKVISFISQSNNSENKMRIDDVSIVPYYKVTYDANGGVTAPAEAWWLPASTDGKYTVSSEISMRAGYKFAGWSLDGVNAVTEVTPANEDIVLVALWEEDPNQQSVEYSFTSNVPGVADGTLSIIAPSASYTTAAIYFADEDGKLEGYTAFGTVSLTEGFGSYTVTGNRAFAEGATALEVVFSGEGVDNVTKTYEIPASHRMAESTLLYTYYVVSDTHLGGSADQIDYFYGQWQNPTGNMRTYALGNMNNKGDVFESDADFVIINGDLVNQGSYITDEGTDVGEERYWNVLDRYIDERLNIHGVPVFLTNGNHEFYQNDRMNTTGAFKPERLIASITGQVDYIDDNYGKTVEIIRDEANENALYYAANMYGTKYIFMSTPELSEDKMTGTYTVSDKQLAFVESQLAEANGNTVFVITHMPVSGLTNKDAVNALLAEYPNTVVFNSHTHVDLSKDAHRTVVGDMTTSFTTCDTGSTISTSNPYSTGQYVEVYMDKVVIKARKFANESEFFGHAIYLIDTPDETAYENAKPVTLEAQEMRIDKVDGNVTSSIRFKATVTAKQKNAASEYGIITTRKTFLESTGEELTFGFEKDGKALYAYGAAYKLDENGKVVTDKITSTEDNGDITFAAVLVGLQNNNADHVNETFVTRSYIKYTNGAKEYTFYGNTAENSLAGVAKNVDTSALSDDYKTAVENIVKLAK